MSNFDLTKGAVVVATGAVAWVPPLSSSPDTFLIRTASGTLQVQDVFGNAGTLQGNGGVFTGVVQGSNFYATGGPGNGVIFGTSGNRSAITDTGVDGVLKISNNAQTGFSRLILGTNDANGASITTTGNNLTFRNGNDTGGITTTSDTFTAVTAFKGPGTVASTGDIRLQYQGVVKTRNSTNLGDITVFSTGSTVANDVSIGGGSTSQITLQNVVGAINGVVADTTNTTAGVPVIVKRGRLTGQTAAVPSVATYTPTADGTFEIGAIVLVTTATNLNFGVHVTWTDEGGTARDQTISFFNPGTGFVTAMTTALGTITYNSASFPLRAKANTAITILTSGTFTTVTYNVEGIIKQIS